MTKRFWKCLGTTVLASGLLTIPAVAEDRSLNDRAIGSDLDLAPLEAESEDVATMDQVTSVSQLTDVRPTDWAFQALQSLVERYGCIVGYPDRTYRGNRALTRYEFAAGLNACIDRVNELIAAATADLVKKEDLATLQRLQEEFRVELVTLRGRVDALEARTTTLEKQQFSTTTKLGVELVTYLADAFGDSADPVNTASLGYRLRLDFDTSFTGKDRLRTRFQATNLRRLNANSAFPEGPLSGATDETRFLATSVSQDGDFRLNRLQYRFPVGERLTLYLDANTIDPSIVTDPITPFNDQVLGSPSNFAQINPIFFPVGNRAGVAANVAIAPSLSLDFGYYGEDTTTGGPNFPDNKSGIFNGGYSAWSHLIFSPGSFKIGLFYANTYSVVNGVDTLAGSNASKVIGAGPVNGSSFGVQTNFRITNGLELGGWVGYTTARALGNGTKGDADVWNFAVNVAFPDLGKKGNLGGLVFGMQPKLTGTSSAALARAIGLPVGQRSDRDTGFHVEAFYRYQLTDYLAITPGVIWLTAPNHDDRNSDVVIGVIRTTFAF
ncbi:carbohydrate porin [Leptolyngbya sp. FACHB-36]|uniref:iron uptake porin n=1 Tax=Leptolyngbya sp. FACHB-36 TaxID=2692808 RepID=UPI001680FBFC|nr:iron uptake porin [Leptolyngbya sp. FACHB-36]MBD2020682.1 carbohydrate porin [Leptolyngbya sp. FACHB-36]